MMIVTHRVVMRTLLAYFAGVDLEDMHKIEVSKHTLYKLEPKPYGADILRYSYNFKTKHFEFVGNGLGPVSE
jgi:6-phosphofructo-2-kinase